jgi:hypothetical protein
VISLENGCRVQFRTTVNKTEVVIDLPGVTEVAFEAIGQLLDQALKRPKVKNRDAIKDAFLTALRTCPTANASDLWHHVVYRRYLEIFNRHRPQDPKQSWVRASGEPWNWRWRSFTPPRCSSTISAWRYSSASPRRSPR